MAHVYTPGLKVHARVRHRVRRVLPISGEVLKAVGERVAARDVVARTFMPGDVTPINLANALSLPPADVAECMLVREGDRIEIGQTLARTKGIFGMFKSEYRSKVSGTVESISPVTGQLIVRGEPIPVQVEAFLAGEVVEVIPRQGVWIEADVTRIQGIFGVGGEAHGVVTMACADHAEELTPELITPDMSGAVVVGGARMTGAAVRRAIAVGAAAVVSGGMDDQDLKEILGYDLGVAITGAEQIGITLIVTEGFGEIAMAERTFQLLASRAGQQASVTGATQIRAGVMRPEILIPCSPGDAANSAATAAQAHQPGVLEIGSPVRIIRDPHFGVIGTVAALPPEPRVLESESKARVLEVRLPGGGTLTVPRANVELIEL